LILIVNWFNRVFIPVLFLKFIAFRESFIFMDFKLDFFSSSLGFKFSFSLLNLLFDSLDSILSLLETSLSLSLF
jgi:hypothetical protein